MLLTFIIFALDYNIIKMNERLLKLPQQSIMCFFSGNGSFVLSEPLFTTAKEVLNYRIGF
jgi:hypothetical protein